VIGRDADVDVVLDDPAASRHHARLIAAGGEVRIADLGSHNGTVVNGSRVDGSRVLSSGDEIAIGDATIAVYLPRRPTLAATAEGTRIRLGEREVIVADPAMIRIYDLIARVGRSELTVLVCGETGVGKENAAYAVHHHSPRRDGPFVSINCAAIQETLAESELFGHERGAFSGAANAKPGLLEAADGGTLFLDEVGELPLAIQAKLLRAVESRRITRVGSLREREINVRIVAATNRDLHAEVRAGRFRDDLLYRLHVAAISLPPLRERPREIMVLARAFLDDACRRAGRSPLAITDATMRALSAHAWPGNVRELRNAMDLVAVTAEGSALEPRDLALAAELAGTSAAPIALTPVLTSIPPPGPLTPVPLTTVTPATEAAPTATVAAPPAAAVTPQAGVAAPPDEAEAAASPASSPDAASSSEPPSPPLTFRPIDEEIEELEARRMLEALEASRGVHTHAAALIGMPLRTFTTKVKLYGLRRRGDRR
jgi:DNA-binding NtrC family response regulator